MNLLVTGGAGFIGSHFVERAMLESSVRRLVCLDALTYAGQRRNLASALADPRFRFAHLNLRDASAVADLVAAEQITHVVHLAAESHVDRSIAGPADFIHTNVLGTFHLLEACRAAWEGQLDGKRFHHVSTDEVYGSLGTEGVFTETTAYAPNSPYSASKAASDLLVRAYHRTYQLPAFTTNATNNYGARQFPEKLIPLAIHRLIRRQPIPIYGDGAQVRDWVFVADHCEGLWKALNGARLGETYIFGAGNERTNLQIVRLICDLVDEFAPELGGNSRALIEHVADRPGHDQRYAVDATKAIRELNWTPRTELEEGIGRTVRWYLAHRDWWSGER